MRALGLTAARSARSEASSLVIGAEQHLTDDLPAAPVNGDRRVLPLTSEGVVGDVVAERRLLSLESLPDVARVAAALGREQVKE